MLKKETVVLINEILRGKDVYNLDLNGNFSQLNYNKEVYMDSQGDIIIKKKKENRIC